MYKTKILKKLTITSNFPLNFFNLEKRYSFLKSKNLLNKNIYIHVCINDVNQHNLLRFDCDKNFIKKKEREIVICFKGYIFKIKNSIFENKIQISIDKNFSKQKLIDILDDLINIKLIQSKFIPIHSSGFSLNKNGYLISSYGGAGKTRIVLEALKFSNKCKIFDEWCLVKDKTLFPLKKEIILMDYDIANNKKFFNKLDYLRAKVSLLIPFQKLKNFFRILKIALPYKYEYYKNINFFDIKKIFFISKKNSITKFEKIEKKIFINQIVRNFRHEKKQLFKLVFVNNSIIKFKNKINLTKTYSNHLNELLKKCKYKNIIINKNEKNFFKIFKNIIAND